MDINAMAIRWIILWIQLVNSTNEIKHDQEYIELLFKREYYLDLNCSKLAAITQERINNLVTRTQSKFSEPIDKLYDEIASSGQLESFQETVNLLAPSYPEFMVLRKGTLYYG